MCLRPNVAYLPLIVQLNTVIDHTSNFEEKTVNPQATLTKNF